MNPQNCFHRALFKIICIACYLHVCILADPICIAGFLQRFRGFEVVRGVLFACQVTGQVGCFDLSVYCVLIENCKFKKQRSQYSH